jgi:hypothetical protein
MMTMMNGPVVRRLLVALVCALPAACVAQAGDITDEDTLASETADHAEAPKVALPVRHEQLAEHRQERAESAQTASNEEAEDVDIVGIPAVPGPDKPQPAPWAGPHPPIGPNQSPSDVTSAN